MSELDHTSASDRTQYARQIAEADDDAAGESSEELLAARKEVSLFYFEDMDSIVIERLKSWARRMHRVSGADHNMRNSADLLIRGIEGLDKIAVAYVEADRVSKSDPEAG